MAVTLKRPGDFLAGSTLANDGGTVPIDTTAGAETATLPTTAPIGFKTTVIRKSSSGTNQLTVAAPSGDTLEGDTVTTATNDMILAVKTAATVWTAALIS